MKNFSLMFLLTFCTVYLYGMKDESPSSENLSVISENNKDSEQWKDLGSGWNSKGVFLAHIEESLNDSSKKRVLFTKNQEPDPRELRLDVYFKLNNSEGIIVYPFRSSDYHELIYIKTNDDLVLLQRMYNYDNLGSFKEEWISIDPYIVRGLKHLFKEGKKSPTLEENELTDINYYLSNIDNYDIDNNMKTDHTRAQRSLSFHSKAVKKGREMGLIIGKILKDLSSDSEKNSSNNSNN